MANVKLGEKPESKVRETDTTDRKLSRRESETGEHRLESFSGMTSGTPPVSSKRASEAEVYAERTSKRVGSRGDHGISTPSETPQRLRLNMQTPPVIVTPDHEDERRASQASLERMPQLGVNTPLLVPESREGDYTSEHTI